MAEKIKNNASSSLGSSILVPSVQELAKQPMIEVPPRYVRPDLHQIPIASSTDPEIPVIDMSNLLSDAAMESELNRLHSACENWGFFQLLNHGVSDSLVEKMKAETKKLFDLPIEEKKKLWQIEGDMEGFGQAFVVSEQQKLDWCDLFFLITKPAHLRKPRLFLNLPLSFRDTLEEYSAAMKHLTAVILEQFEKALGIKKGEMTEILLKEGNQMMRMNYYPACPEPEKVIGLTPHSDGGGLTILLQINQVEGLKIKKHGNWIAVNPLPNAFIVNIGDIIEMVTNGKYKSVEHCATVNSKSERLSIATFSNPSLEKEIRAAPSLITPHSPPLFTTLTYQQHLKGFLTRKLDGKSYRDAMLINHPPT